MKDITWIKERLIAHRGLHSEDKTTPENSLAAYQKAIDHNYGIEMDINVMKDGTVVAFHDITLNRLCGIDGNLSNLNYDDVTELRLLATNQHIPTLQEVLDLVDGRVPLLIELKPHGDSVLLCTNFMKIMGNYNGVYGIHSFNPGIVRWFKKNHPEVIRGQITEYFRNDTKMKRLTKYLMKSMFFNRFNKPDFVNYGLYDLPNKYCDKAYKKGLCIIAYASRNQKDFDMVKKHYDNSVFEFFIPKE